MTHESEMRFEERVIERLRELYGEESVKEQYYFEDTGRWADAIVLGPVASFAIEIENDFEAAIEGVGQSQLYASEVGPLVPMVIVPRGHTDQPETDLLRNWGTLVIEFDAEEGEFYSGVAFR